MRREINLVFLFSGHMIDRPSRAEPRFPNEKSHVNIVRGAIAKKLDDLGASRDDLALCGGACGGDLLFAEACLERNVPLEIRIPFNESIFLQKSVSFAGDIWTQLYYKVKGNPLTNVYVMSDADELSKGPERISAYTRNNKWQLYTALGLGPQRLRFICLWDRKGGEGPGGTKDMYEQVLNHSGEVHVLDTNLLFSQLAR